MYLITQYMQLVLDMTPMRAGIQLMPAVIASIVTMLLSPVASARVGAFTVISIGLAAGALGFGLMVIAPDSGSVSLATTAIVLIGAGLGAALTVSIDGIIAAVPPERAGAGASVSETANELGTAMGTAVLGSIAAAVYRSRLSAATTVPPDYLVRAKETLGEATVLSVELGGPEGEALVAAAKEAFIGGLRLASAVAVVALALATASAVRYRSAN